MATVLRQGREIALDLVKESPSGGMNGLSREGLTREEARAEDERQTGALKARKLDCRVRLAADPAMRAGTAQHLRLHACVGQNPRDGGSHRSHAGLHHALSGVLAGPPGALRVGLQVCSPGGRGTEPSAAFPPLVPAWQPLMAVQPAGVSQRLMSSTDT